ncbi:putative phage repressor [uncultured delta proteobacterium]|uniref:Putative phage repressor n=1 Tax=uncultured delta proteobacterium TaxID=34034 RepID=A0A212K0E5_9DELT|nr:putative phage repressor [uncultured delta proteobacterium]
MSNFDEIFERIKLATRTRTQIELANVLDIRQSSISDAKRRNSVPSDWCMKLFERFGLNPDWIKKGTGPMYLRTETGYAPVDAELPLAAREEAALYSDANAKNVVVSVYSMQPCPGPDQECNGHNGHKVVGKLSVPLSLAGDGVKVFLLDSTGMEPLIRKGAHIGVDTTQKQIVSGELYAVTLPYEGVGIKRVFPDSAKAQALLRAENPLHPEVSLPLETLGEVIFGRIVWALNKY